MFIYIHGLAWPVNGSIGSKTHKIYEIKLYTVSVCLSKYIKMVTTIIKIKVGCYNIHKLQSKLLFFPYSNVLSIMF